MTTLEDINKQEKEIKNLEDNLLRLQDNIRQSREFYRQLVEKYYDAEPPFPGNRPDSEFADDVRKFQEIIKYSLRAGDDRLFKQWLIQPLRDGNLSILARRNKIKDYVFAIDRLISTHVSATELDYLKQIKEALLPYNRE